MLFPTQELDPKRINEIKRAAKFIALQKATNNFKKPVTDFVLREGVLGDSTTTDFYDIEPLTVITAGIPIWGADQGDTTSGDLSAYTKAAEVVDDNKWIVFYGFYDQALEARALTGAADTPPSAGSVMAHQFKRGSSVLDHWVTEHLYGYDDVVGISDTPVVYEENESIQLLVNLVEATEDKFFGLRNYVCEPVGLGHLNPIQSMNIEARAMGVQNVSMLPLEQQINAVLRAGIDPIQELSHEQIARIYGRAQAGLFQMIVEDGYARNAREAKENFFVRPFVGGDESAATDTYVDVDLMDSGAALAGEEEWYQLAGIFTAGDLKNIVASGETINDKNYVAIFGVADRTAVSRLLSVAPGDGAGNLEFWDVQHLYAYHSAVKGLSERITYYKQNAPFAFKANVAVAIAHNIAPIGLVAESYGDVVSKT